MRRLILTTALAALPCFASAEDAALVFGNERYEQLDRISRGAGVVSASQSLEGLGFVVYSLANARAESGADRLAEFLEAAGDAERLVVVLSGRFVSQGDRNWFLYTDADAPGMFSMGSSALSLDSVMQVLAARPGQSVLMLAEVASAKTQTTDTYLQSGIGELDIPQGVTVLRTGPREAASFMRNALAQPEGDLAAAVQANSAVTGQGFLPESWILMPTAVEVEESDPTTPEGPSQSELNAEAQMWDRTTATDTVQAYRAYIRAYPQGRFVTVAEETIAEILAEPNRTARLAEEALNLTRAQRRSVQGDLTVLGYNTRGIDGILGQGSRRAILNWQQSNGYPQSSYLSRDQISRMNAQAERRRAEIEAQQALEQAEAERLDRTYWSETGGRGDEPGYRAYLSRYPDGVFAEIAQQRLDSIEAERRQEAEVADRTAWGRAAAENSVTAYQDYLAAFPSGVFAQQARTRIEAMSEPTATEAQIADARRQERSLRLSGVRAQLLELRLRDLGFNPGPLDGVIDRSTRSALRAYQASSGIAPTGFVDQATVVQLMAGNTGR